MKRLGILSHSGDNLFGFCEKTIGELATSFIFVESEGVMEIFLNPAMVNDFHPLSAHCSLNLIPRTSHRRVFVQFLGSPDRFGNAVVFVD